MDKEMTMTGLTITTMGWTMKTTNMKTTLKVRCSWICKVSSLMNSKLTTDKHWKRFRVRLMKMMEQLLTRICMIKMTWMIST